MATYTAQSLVHAGTQPTWQAPTSGDLAPTGPANYLVVFNGSASSITVTLPIAPTYDGLAIGGSGRTVTVPASTLAAPAPVLIPLPSSVYGAGTTVVNYSATTTVSVAVIAASVS
jgi:hypothetical protein